MPSRFTLTMIDTARGNLDALPEADNNTRQVSLRGAIRVLTPTLRKLERKGYSRQKLVELLAEQGLSISLSSLKDYLGAASSRKPARSQTRGQPTTAPPARSEANARTQSRTPSAQHDDAEPAKREGVAVAGTNGAGRTAPART